MREPYSLSLASPRPYIQALERLVVVNRELLVNEIFGPTIQGEGPHTGRPCAFIRLAICPLHCSWCDTPYTWAFTEAKAQTHQLHQVFNQADEVHSMTVPTIVDRVLSKLGNGRMVVISGGEPLAQI